jgi:hypothetical protein
VAAAEPDADGGAFQLALVLLLAALSAYRFSQALVSYAVVDAINAPWRQGVDALVWPETAGTQK